MVDVERGYKKWLEGITTRDLQRWNYWKEKGFSPKEAQWAIMQKIPISGQTAKWLAKGRKEELKFYMTKFHVATREEAIKQASSNMRRRNIEDGYDPYNIFRIMSP